MKKMSKKPRSYHILFEGEMEEILFNWIKLNIFKIGQDKLKICKEHRCNNRGTVRLEQIKDNKCCFQIVVMDVDDISDADKYRKKQNENNLIIISDPCLEVVLYAIFEVCDAELDKKTLEQKLNQKLKDCKLEYKHKLSDLKNICMWLENNPEKINQWFKNLEKLNELEKSNFIEIINFLRKYNKE